MIENEKKKLNFNISLIKFISKKKTINMKLNRCISYFVTTFVMVFTIFVIKKKNVIADNIILKKKNIIKIIIIL